MNVLLKQFQPHLFIFSAINISNKEITNYLKEIKIFLKSESFIEHWNQKIVYKKIIEKIHLFILGN